jgi:hypothetical protein
MRMRTRKVSLEKYSKLCETMGHGCQFIKLPSSLPNFFYPGLVMAGEAVVAWPENLTEDEMKLYEERYGSLPDIFDPDFEERIKITNVIRG